MSDHMVSPPASGTTTDRSMDAIAGRFMNVMSVCQKSVRSLPLSMEWISLRSSTCGSTGWLSVSSPKRRANAICVSSSRCWSGKKTTSRSSQTRRMAATVSSSRSAGAVDAVDLGADGGAERADVEPVSLIVIGSMVASGSTGGTTPGTTEKPRAERCCRGVRSRDRGSALAAIGPGCAFGNAIRGDLFPERARDIGSFQARFIGAEGKSHSCSYIVMDFPGNT